MSKKSRKNLVKQVIQPVNDNAGENVGSKPHDGIDRSPAKVAEAKAIPKKKVKRRTTKSDGSKRFDFKAAESQAAACQSVYIKKSDITTIISIGSQILGKFIAALWIKTVPWNGTVCLDMLKFKFQKIVRIFIFYLYYRKL